MAQRNGEERNGNGQRNGSIANHRSEIIWRQWRSSKALGAGMEALAAGVCVSICLAISTANGVA